MYAKIESAHRLPRDVARQIVGGWALAFDSAAEVLRAPDAFAMQVERRGVEVENNIGSLLRSLQKSSASNWKRIRSGATQPLRWARREATENTQYAEVEIEHQVERVLERMGIPTRDRLDRLGREIDSLTTRIEGELSRMAEGDPRPVA